MKSRLSKSRIKIAVSTLICAGFVAAVQGYVGWGELLSPWRQMPLGALGIAVILTSSTYLARAMRLFDYFRDEMQGAFALCLKLLLQHNLLNNLLPMRSGELSFPLLMSRYFNVPVTRSVPSLLWFRLLDLHTLGTLGLVALGYGWLGNSAAIPVIVLWSLVPWLLVRFAHCLGERLGRRKPARLTRLALGLLNSLPGSPSMLLRSWIWTLVNWSIKIGVYAWILLQFTSVTYSAALVGAIGGDLTSVLPIHGVAGTGTFEAGVVAALVPFDVEPVSALEAAVNLHLFVLGSSLMGGLLSLCIARTRRPEPEARPSQR